MASKRPKSWINGKPNPAYGKWYYRKNKRRHQRWMKRWYKRNRTKVLCSSKRWYRSNKPRKHAKAKVWRDKHSEQVAQHCQNYRNKVGHEAFRERQNFLNRERRKKNPMLIIRDRLTVRLRRAIQHMKSGKFVPVTDLIGCSMEEFKAHIESLFKPGMTWENIGLWHLDHRVPVCSFIPFDLANQKKAFHWSNYQPLWKTENLRKTDKLPCGTSMRTIKKRLNGSQPTLSKVE